MNFRTFSGILLLGCFIATSCHQTMMSDEDKDTTGHTTGIGGILHEGAGQNVVLEEMAAREFIPIDTVTCDQEGAFQISFEPEKSAFYVLRIGPAGYITLLMEPGEMIEFEGTYGQTGQYVLKGSKGSELLKTLSQEHKQTLDALRQITRRNMVLQSSDNFAALKEKLDIQFDSITHAFQEYSREFIKEHQESLVILVALYNLYGQGLPVFHHKRDQDVYRFVDSALTSRYSEYEMVQLLHAQVTGQVAGQKEKQVPGPGLGKIAPDFVSSRPDGEQISLSDLNGNYVLLVFWAGWSKPSRDENKVLSEVWKRYHAMPFRILQVSFDDQKAGWLEAIEEDNLAWDQVSDLQRWETIVADLYQVERIPTNFLIDPEGRIIGKDLYGDKLLEQMETIFGKN